MMQMDKNEKLAFFPFSFCPENNCVEQQKNVFFIFFNTWSIEFEKNLRNNYENFFMIAIMILWSKIYEKLWSCLILVEKKMENN